MKAYCKSEATEWFRTPVEFWGETTLVLIYTIYQLSISARHNVSTQEMLARVITNNHNDNSDKS